MFVSQAYGEVQLHCISKTHAGKECLSARLTVEYDYTVCQRHMMLKNVCQPGLRCEVQLHCISKTHAGKGCLPTSLTVKYDYTVCQRHMLVKDVCQPALR